MKSNIIYKAISLTDLENFGLVLNICPIEMKILSGTYKGEIAKLGAIYKSLFLLGMQNNENISVQDKVSHRTVSGHITSNYRIIGEERSDSQWLSSGNASDEVRASKSKMKDMGSCMSRLSNGGKV